MERCLHAWLSFLVGTDLTSCWLKWRHVRTHQLELPSYNQRHCSAAVCRVRLWSTLQKHLRGHVHERSHVLRAVWITPCTLLNTLVGTHPLRLLEAMSGYVIQPPSPQPGLFRAVSSTGNLVAWVSRSWQHSGSPYVLGFLPLAQVSLRCF